MKVGVMVTQYYQAGNRSDRNIKIVSLRTQNFMLNSNTSALSRIWFFGPSESLAVSQCSKKLRISNYNLELMNAYWIGKNCYLNFRSALWLQI